MRIQLKHRRLACSVLLVAIAATLGGCAVAALVGGAAESYRRQSKVERPAEYLGLKGGSFAVVVSTDRYTQAAFPALVGRLTQQITNELAVPERTGAVGAVPGPTVLQFQYENPDWSAWTYQELAEEFGVDNLIVVDLYEFRLYEVGNANIYDGKAAARVGVVENGGPLGDDFIFTREIQVGFPDGGGYGPTDFPESTVQTVVEARLIDRVTWLFYDHMEDYYPKY